MDTEPKNMDISLIAVQTGSMSLAALLAHHESGHFRYRQSWATERDDPQDHLLIWVLHGHMDVRINDTERTAPPGSVVLLDPHVPHRYQPREEPGWEWLWLHCGGSAVPDLWSRLRGAIGPVRSLGIDPLIRSRFGELVTAAASSPVNTTGIDDRLRVDSCAYSLFGLLVDRLETPGRTEGGERGDLSALTTWILEHLGAPITVADLARASGWSAAHLTRMTRREIGLAPLQYVTRLRMTRAERLLADTELTVAEVAAMVGFADPLHFSRRFRQQTGRPPSQARTSTGPGQVVMRPVR